MDDEDLPDNHDRSFSDDWLPSWKTLKSALLDEWSNRKLEKGSSHDTGKGKGVLPVAMNGVEVVSCYGCGIEGHKKGDPVCKAEKFDVHSSAPQDYRERMAKGKKREGDKKKPPKLPGKPGAKEGGKDKKHCHAFDFGKGTCRFGAKCRYLHEKGGGDAKLAGFTPEQKKLVSTLLSSAMKRTASAIAKKNKQNKKKAKVEVGKKESDDEEDFSSILAACFFALIKNTIRRDFTPMNGIVLAADLHSVHKNCGIDSDAGISISTMREDFAWLDESKEAKESINSPSGINGGTSTIGGRGPMIVRAKTGEFLIDPDRVYFEGGNDQPNFRVLSTQRLKVHGVRLVGCFKGTDVDVLQDRTSKKTIALAEEGPTEKKILVLNTMKCPVFANMKSIKATVEDIKKRNRSAMIYDFEDDMGIGGEIDKEIADAINELDGGEIPDSVMTFNLADVSDEERSRVYCRRFGYCNPLLLKKMSKDENFGKLPKLIDLNEDNAIMDAGKCRKKRHHIS